MRIVKPHYYGIDHTKITAAYEGNPTFCNEFCVRGEYQPCAVYYCAKPNKRKKHKTYLLLFQRDGAFYVTGMSPREMEKYRHQEAIHCFACDDVVYSVMRHDMRSCSCGKVSIDGGKDYTKVSFQSGASYKILDLDLLTDTISDPK